MRLLKRFGAPGTGNNPLGLALAGCGKGLLYAAICVLPMFVGYALTGNLNRSLTADGIITGSVMAGFFEELFFRAFLFGFLFRYCRWGFIPAVLLNGLFFGALHLYQGYDLLSALASFGVTFGAAVLYSWIYAEWRFNLWTVVWLHALMNLSWMIFSVASTAAGNFSANIFRVVTIILAIAYTVIYKRQRGEKFAVNTRTLLVNNQPDSI
ncbi:MAG: CPBP family intramembrane metalloprotease [Alistipes sp.]|nr:CPBP family intramembrane metalloprotease [Alistipes sp.]